MPTKRAVYEIAEFKASTDRPGEFTALISVYGNVDLQGDRVMPGAFTKSLAAWKTSGDPIPVIWSHTWGDPFAHVGVVTSWADTPKGLQITGKNDVDKPFAKQVHDLLVARRVKEFSFAYDVLDEKRAKDGANELLELGIIEVGPTLKGANPETQLIGAKKLLDDAAAKERDDATSRTASLTGRKVYLDADLPGTFEETRDAIGEAARTLLNPSADENTWVYVEATFPDHALVSVMRAGEEEHYQIDWSRDGDEIKLGEPVAVAVEVTVTPKSAKAGRRLSQATQTEMQSIRDDQVAVRDNAASIVTRMDALMGVAEDESGTNSEAPAGAKDAAADLHESEEQNDTKATEGPTAKSTDETVSELRTRISEMRATTGIPA